MDWKMIVVKSNALKYKEIVRLKLTAKVRAALHVNGKRIDCVEIEVRRPRYGHGKNHNIEQQ